MTTAPHYALELLEKDSLKAVCASVGPFVTVYLPACHPGSADTPRSPRLKAILRNAAAALESRHYQESIDELLAPIEEMAGDPAAMAGGADSVVFRSPGFLAHFRLPEPAGELLVVANHAHIAPLLSGLTHAPEFYVLAISRKHLRLGRWTAGVCEELPLPASIPPSLAEFGAFDQPDHDLETRSASGPSTGQMGGVRVGTLSDREKDNDYLHNYFRLVDRELGHMLHDAPLVTIGVEYELGAYLKAAAYPHTLCARHTNPDHLTWAEMGARAQHAIAESRQEEAERALKEFRETPRRDRVASGVKEVLAAALEGRVHRLLLAKGAEYLEDGEDLLNAAAAETIRGGGEVYVLDPLKLAGAGPVAAMLRYSRPGT